MEQTNKRPLVILTGPTAVGKTAASIGLAKAIGGEIISADSMQVYKEMDIGSAKIRPEEMDGVPHHLVDVLDPSEDFNVVLFQQMAKEAMEGIYQRGHIPIVVGGTGFYIQALLYDVQFQEEREGSSYRKKLEEIARTEGAEVLHERLKKVDPESAEAIHKNNVKRVIRALEYYEETGRPISVHNKEQRENESPYNFLYIVLTMDRKKLYARINRRVDQMAEQGLAEEVTGLHEEGYDKGLTSMQAIGYKEWFPFFEGKCSKEEVIEQIKKDTRHFAKRQLTWFRREKDVIWLNKPDFDYDEEKILSYMLDRWNEIVSADAKEEGEQSC